MENIISQYYSPYTLIKWFTRAADEKLEAKDNNKQQGVANSITVNISSSHLQCPWFRSDPKDWLCWVIFPCYPHSIWSNTGINTSNSQGLLVSTYLQIQNHLTIWCYTTSAADKVSLNMYYTIHDYTCLTCCISDNDQLHTYLIMLWTFSLKNTISRWEASHWATSHSWMLTVHFTSLASLLSKCKWWTIFEQY